MELYADDRVLNVESEEKLQVLVDKSGRSSDIVSLIISVKEKEYKNVY